MLSTYNKNKEIGIGQANASTIGSEKRSAIDEIKMIINKFNVEVKVMKVLWYYEGISSTII